jgi:hypothetical protein
MLDEMIEYWLDHYKGNEPQLDIPSEVMNTILKPRF